MKRLISLLVVGAFLVSTPTFGGIKVEEVERTSELPQSYLRIRELKVTDWVRYRIKNRNYNVFRTSWGHFEKMKKQGATLCLEMGYRWMGVMDQTHDTIEVACFSSLERAKKLNAPELIDCEALSPSWMRSPPPMWLEKFKAKQKRD